ncbi:hypothetical protein CHS0354_026978 [Potamilus streckersoni]|uniref:CUB domain-containing protein n=1 Tax=Potamilus streckersoni TaxID=2493646 RepID=A0AAE0VTC4_9BIVA|nr:hypothetical protein CHS0354_026978 [Potamilus streckersoni]
MELIKKAFILAFVGLHYLCAGIPNVNSIQLCMSRYTFVQEIGDSGIIWFDEIKMGNGYPNPCILQIESCSSCRLTVSLIDFDYFTCSSQDFRDDSCSYQCNYMYIFDAHYKNQTIHYYRSKSQFTSPFISESSSIFIGLCHRSATVNMTLRYVVTKKTIKIQSSSLGENSTGYITSPFFPTGYAQNYENYEFEIISDNQNDYIQVTFDDWDLSPKTELAFDNSNIVGPVYGANYRPVVVSNSYRLTVFFNTGPPTSIGSEKNFMGFKATYRFVSNSNLISSPETACGHYTLNTHGGVLEFKPSGPYDKYFDCVWVVKKQPGYDAIHMKLIEFSSRLVNVSGKRNKVEIYRGLTSMGEKLEEIMSSSTPFFESDNMGFYVRLTGRYQSQDKLVLSFASYISTSLVQQCTGQMYMCSNYRCIDGDLHCDGNDNCGDISDELEDCISGRDKSYHYTGSIGVIIPVAISAFLIVVICLLFIMIRKCRQSNSARRNQNTIPSVSSNVSRRRRGRRRRARERDSPPSYDEAIQSPPSWYCNLTFNISASDAALPSPPSYSEAIHEDVLLVNTSVTPGSPNSTDSNQSERCHHPVYDTSSSSSNSEVVDSHRPVSCRQNFSYSSVDSEFDTVPYSANLENNPSIINEHSSAISRRPDSTPRYAGQRSDSQQKNRVDDWKGVKVIDENLCAKNRAQKVKRKKKKRGQQKLKSERQKDLNESTAPEQGESRFLMQQENINAQHASRPKSRITNRIISSVMPDQSNTSVQRQMFDVTRPVESSSHSRSRSRSPLQENIPVTMPCPSHKRSRNSSKPCNQENKMNTMGKSPVQDFTMEDNLADQKSCSGSRDTLIPCRNYGNQGNQSTTSIRSADMPISLRNRSRSSSDSDTCSPPNQRKKIRKKRRQVPVSSSAQQTPPSSAATQVAMQRPADNTQVIMGSEREELCDVHNRSGSPTVNPPTGPALYFMTLYREGGEDEDVFV